MCDSVTAIEQPNQITSCAPNTDSIYLSFTGHAGMNGSILNALGLTNSQKGSGSVLIAEVCESLSGAWPMVMGSSGVRDTLLEVISCVPPL